MTLLNLRFSNEGPVVAIRNFFNPIDRQISKVSTIKLYLKEIR